MKTIKKIGCLFLLVATISLSAQESTLLRYNFKKGDKYLLEMSLKQDMASMMNMDLGFKMMMESNGKVGDNYKIIYSFERMVMKMIAAGNEVNFDSDEKEENMGEEEKKMKAEMAPFFEMLMHQTINKYGKVIGMKIEPDVKGANQFFSQSQLMSMEYPKEQVKVGSEWSHSQSISGMEMKGTYIVKKITKDKVFADFLGNMSSTIEGKITGTAEVSRSSGMILDMTLDMNISTGGMDMTMNVHMKAEKVK